MLVDPAVTAKKGLFGKVIGRVLSTIPSIMFTPFVHTLRNYILVGSMNVPRVSLADSTDLFIKANFGEM